MDLRALTYYFAVIKLPEAFEEWRESKIKEADLRCSKLRNFTVTDLDLWHKRYMNLVNFPKTIVRLTRQMCFCDDNCVGYSMFYTKFDENCTYYDLKDLLTDDRYYKSEIINRKVVNNELQNINFPQDEFTLKKNIYNDLVRLCNNDKTSILDLTCKAYELKDFCQDNSTCFNSMLKYDNLLQGLDQKVNGELCNNPAFKEDLFKIQEKINFTPLYRPKRETLEISNSSDNLGFIKTALYILICLLMFLMIRKNFRVGIIFGLGILITIALLFN